MEGKSSDRGRYVSLPVFSGGEASEKESDGGSSTPFTQLLKGREGSGRGKICKVMERKEGRKAVMMMGKSCYLSLSLSAASQAGRRGLSLPILPLPVPYSSIWHTIYYV